MSLALLVGAALAQEPNATVVANYLKQNGELYSGAYCQDFPTTLGGLSICYIPGAPRENTADTLIMQFVVTDFMYVDVGLDDKVDSLIFTNFDPPLPVNVTDLDRKRRKQATDDYASHIQRVRTLLGL